MIDVSIRRTMCITAVMEEVAMVVYGGRPETERVPVEVIARISEDGLVTPIRVLWPDGRRFEVWVTHREQRYDRMTRTPVTEYTVDVPLPNGSRRATHMWWDGRQFWVERKA